ncbi:MAG: hypothetical protein JJE25_09520 [Bacteroidia bacterium]|nr:hypothetical protein [Bacteroidia bacterium]
MPNTKFHPQKFNINFIRIFVSQTIHQYAMYLEHHSHREAVHRIHRLSGSFTGFEKMLLQDDAYDIAVQLMAMQGSHSSFSAFMHECFLMDANLKLHTPLPAILQTPEMLQYIANTKVQLPHSTHQQLLQIMRTLKQKKNIC